MSPGMTMRALHSRRSSATFALLLSLTALLLITPGPATAQGGAPGTEPANVQVAPGDGILTVSWTITSREGVDDDEIRHALRWSQESGVWANPTDPKAVGANDGISVEGGVTSYTITGLKNDVATGVFVRSFIGGSYSEQATASSNWVRVKGEHTTPRSAEPTLTPTPVPTHTSEPTPTPMPTPTSEPTPTPMPTPTSEPTPTPMPTPTGPPPGPPRELDLLLGVTSIEAKWLRPLPDIPLATGYRIRWRDSDDAADAWQPSAEGHALPGTARYYEITGLERSHYPQSGGGYLPLVRKSYVVEVAADGDGGTGEWTSRKSDELASRTAPSAPQNLSASGEWQLVVTWDAPGSAGEREFINFRPGSTPSPPAPEVHGYYVRWREASAGGAPGPWLPNSFGLQTTETTYTIAGLDNGKEYDVQVRASNDLHAVGARAELKATPEFGLPTELTLRTGTLGAPFGENMGGLTIRAVLDEPAPAGGVKVTVAPDPDDPGTAIVGVDYTLSPTFTLPEGSMGAAGGHGTLHVINDAINERDETVNLTATANVAGIVVSGVTVTIVDDETSVERPGSYLPTGVYTPQNLKVEARDGSLTVTFDPALSNETNTYWLDWRTDDNPEWTTIQGVASPYLLDNLANGVLHHVRVSGISGLFHDGTTVSDTPAVQGPVPQNPGEMGLSASKTAVAEDAGSVTVRATLHSPAPPGGVTVRLVASSGATGTAVQGADYALPPAFVIPAGKREAKADVRIIDNEVNEADKTINLTATVSDSRVAVVTDPLTITIQDNEQTFGNPVGNYWTHYQLQNLVVVPGDGSLKLFWELPDRLKSQEFGPGRHAYWLQWRADDNPEWTTIIGGGHATADNPRVISGLTNGVPHHVRVTTAYNQFYNGLRYWGGWAGSVAIPNEPGNLSLMVDSRTVNENVGTVTVTVAAVLGDASSVDVTLAAGASSTATTGADFTLPDPFAITQGDTVRKVKVAIVNDRMDEGGETIVLRASTSPSLTVAGTTFTIADDDTAGVTVSAETPLTVTEAGGDGHTASYTVVLDSRPAAGVTVTPDSGDPTAAVVSGALTFGPENWSKPQTVTVTAVDDDDKEHDTLDVTHSVTSADPKYDGVSPSNGTVAVKTADDDLPTLVWEYGSQTITEQDGDFIHHPRVWFRNASPGQNTFYVTMEIKTESTATRTAGACAEGSDYLQASHRANLVVTFTGTSKFAVMPFTVCGDDVEEPDETIVFRILPNPDQYTILGGGETVITVKDDDDTGGL